MQKRLTKQRVFFIYILQTGPKGRTLQYVSPSPSIVGPNKRTSSLTGGIRNRKRVCFSTVLYTSAVSTQPAQHYSRLGFWMPTFPPPHTYSVRQAMYQYAA